MYVKADEVARHLGVTKNTVYKWAREGDIPCHVFGRKKLFVIEEIDEHSKKGEINVRKA